MVDRILKLDYSLAIWFSKTKDRVVKGTAFLFLNKLTFLWTFIYSFISKKVFFNQDVKVYIGVLIVGSIFIMYGLQKPIERIVIKGNYKKEYKSLLKSHINRRRVFGLLLFLLSFYSMVIFCIFIFK